MNLRALAPAALVGFGLAVCASAQTYSELHGSEPAVASGFARVYFYRPPEGRGAYMQPAVLVNGVKVGDALPVGYFYVDEPPGIYDISTTQGKEIIHVIIRAGQARYVRLDVSLEGLAGGNVTPELVVPDLALTEITDCHYIGAKASTSS